MAEQFIEEIYMYSDFVYDLKNMVEYCDYRNRKQLGLLWNKNSEKIDIIFRSMNQIDSACAGEFRTCIYKIVPSIQSSDYCAVSYMIEDGIIPVISRFLKVVGTIDVVEEDYRLVSSSVGYLGICNARTGNAWNNLSDPMWEARKIAQKLYKPYMDSFLIMGIGMGYLAYQLYLMSHGTLHIYVYEKNQVLVDYARNYGVLDRIPSENITIRVINNESVLIQEFVGTDVDLDYAGAYFSEYMRDEFITEQRAVLGNLIDNQNHAVWFSEEYEFNYYRNKKHFSGIYTELADCSCSEYIVVAGGPSVDENIEFIRSSVGKRKIIAVSTILKKLLNEGIKPDIVAIMDPTELVMSHITGIEDSTKELTLVAESVACSKYIDSFKGKVYAAFSGENEWVNKASSEAGIKKWSICTTVTTFAVELAAGLGATQIYLVGADMGYPGGIHYSTGVDASASGTGNLQVIANDGKIIETSNVLNNFRLELEDRIKSMSGIKIYNMSKHGAKIAGTNLPK